MKGHIAVANFKLKKNTSGSEVDCYARKYLKQIGLDYAHGTGHGVDIFLMCMRDLMRFQKEIK